MKKGPKHDELSQLHHAQDQLYVAILVIVLVLASAVHYYTAEASAQVTAAVVGTIAIFVLIALIWANAILAPRIKVLENRILLRIAEGDRLRREESEAAFMKVQNTIRDAERHANQ